MAESAPVFQDAFYPCYKIVCFTVGRRYKHWNVGSSSGAAISLNLRAFQATVGNTQVELGENAE